MLGGMQLKHLESSLCRILSPFQLPPIPMNMNGTSAPGGSGFSPPSSNGAGGGRPRDGEGRKLFVGGLPGTCEKQHMESYFGQFGQVDDACVMFDRNTGRSRGFGFVVYNQLTDLETCLASGPHVLLDKTVDVKRASMDPPPASGGKGGKGGYSGKGKGDRRGDNGMDGGRGPSEGDNPCKIFVGGLPNSCDQARLSEHFSQYGAIDEAIVMYEKDTGRHRGFGYVVFSSPADADKAIASRDNNKIDDRWVEVKHARREAPRGKGKGRPMGYGSGGLSGSGGGYGQRPPPPSYQSGGGYNRPQQQYGQQPMYNGPPSGGGGYHHHQQPMMQQQPAPPPSQYGGYGTSPYGARQGGGGYGGPPQPAPYGGGYGQAPPPRQGYGQQQQQHGSGYRASPY